MNLSEKIFWKTRCSLQRFQYRNEYAYWFYYNLYRKYRGLKLKLPSKTTDLHLEGFPRSGNTFSLSIVRESLMKNNPSLEIVHHCHTSASVKRSHRLKIPTVILLRNSLDAVASSYIKFFALRNLNIPQEINKTLLKNDLLLYYDFYMYALEMKVKIILFDDLIKEPFAFIQALEKIISNRNKSLNLSSPSDVKNGIRRAEEAESGKKPMGSSLPNEKRRKSKEILKVALRQFDEFKTVKRIYSNLKKNKLYLC